MTKYAGMQANRIVPDGSHVRVTLSSGTGQGNGGTSLPCKGCYVQAAIDNTEVVRMNIGAAASSSVGIDLGRPETDSNNTGSCQPMWVPIDDVAELYFYSADANGIVDILYLLG